MGGGAAGVKSGNILRSEDAPEGLAGLKPRELEYVNEENLISKGMIEFLTKWNVKEVGFSRGSLMWKLSWVKDLTSMKGVFLVDYDECMVGGNRPKEATWCTNVEELKCLAGVCDGNHVHAPWSMHRDKDEESAYPKN